MKRYRRIVIIFTIVLMFTACSSKRSEISKSSKGTEVTKVFSENITEAETESFHKEDTTVQYEEDTTHEQTETKQEENTTHKQVETKVEESMTDNQTETKKPEIQTEEATEEGIKPETSQMTTAIIVEDMGIGINLGNTFEACGDWINGKSVTDYETAWGSPVITKEMIDGYRREGFKTLRIPVAWSNMMGENYTINPALISRVKEVTDWALECDMYVIINIHWDNGWWEEFPYNEEKCMEKYVAIWTQLADSFGDYDERVIFESLNEEGCWDSVWNRYSNDFSGKEKAYDLLNRINQKFVDVVRSSGHNNAMRHLLIAGYATDVELTCDALFKMPKDVANRLAISVHYYTPANYCVISEDATWGQAKREWGTDEDYAELKKNMDMLYERFVQNGVPVIMGEFGCVMDNKTKENATLFLVNVATYARERKICPVLWDTTSAYSFYNRESCSMSEYPKLKEELMKIQ